MKKLVWLTITVGILVVLAVVVVFALPAFAETKVATWIPGQPLTVIAAQQIILDSGLPKEKLPDGTTSAVTRGRDAVNAYRYAHTQLSKNGWYRGISEDHTPLLVALVEALEKEGFTSGYSSFEMKKTRILERFWQASDTQNAKDLGFSSLEDLREKGTARQSEDFNAKWH